MTAREPHPPAAPEALAAQRQRDAALKRIARTRTLVMAGAAGLTAGVSAFAASLAPGRTLSSGHLTAASSRVARPSAPSGSPGTPASSSSLRMPALATPAELGLQAPDQAPASGQASAPSQAPAPRQTPVSPDSTQAQTQVAPAPAAPSATRAPTVVSGGS